MKTREEYAAEYRDDEPKPRKPYACREGLCGCPDCKTCFPFGDDEQEDEE